MLHEGVFIIHLAIRDRGGRFSAVSEDLPGLHVYGETMDDVLNSSMTAVKLLFKRNRGMDVDVRPVATDIESFPDVRTFDRVAVQRAA